MAGDLLDTNPAVVPEVRVSEEPRTVDDTLYPARTNAALQLAGALQEVHPAVNEFIQRYAQVASAAQAAKAQQDALRSKQNTFADAVRAGDIEPTQNPWYIQAYNRNAAIRATNDAAAKINTDSASWAEQNDPVAFQKKYQQALSDFGQQFTTADGREGFNQAAQQAWTQANATNTAYNVERIKVERQQDLSSLTGKAILDTVRRVGPGAPIALIQRAIAPYYAEWHGTGGTDTDWNKVVLGAVEDAAFNAKDETILDLAKKIPTVGGQGGFLYDMEGAGREVTQSSYRIMGEKRDIERMGMQQAEYQQYIQTQQAEGSLFAQYGPNLYSGNVDLANDPTLRSLPPAIAAATVRSISQTAMSLKELATVRMFNYQHSPDGAATISQIESKARNEGWTPQLDNEVGLLGMRGLLEPAEQDRILSQAKATSQKLLNPMNGANSTLAGQVQHSLLDQYKVTTTEIGNNLARFESVLAKSHIRLTAQDQNDLAFTAKEAAANYLQASPGDWVGAKQAAKQASITWATSHFNMQPGNTPVRPAITPPKPFTFNPTPEIIQQVINSGAGQK